MSSISQRLDISEAKAWKRQQFEQKYTRCRIYLLANPDKTNVEIGAYFHIDPRTVAELRAEVTGR